MHIGLVLMLGALAAYIGVADSTVSFQPAQRQSPRPLISLRRTTVRPLPRTMRTTSRRFYLQKLGTLPPFTPRTTAKPVRCNCNCTLDYKPVCARDDSGDMDTFPNECSLLCYNCTHNKNYTIRVRAECK